MEMLLVLKGSSFEKKASNALTTEKCNRKSSLRVRSQSMPEQVGSISATSDRVPLQVLQGV